MLGGQCLVGWKTISRSKKNGGLGVLKLEDMNLALLSKWWWRFFSDKKTLWGPLINSLYYTRRRPLREGAAFKPYSSLWRSVLWTSDFFKCGGMYGIGDGRRVNWWTDIWFGQVPFCTLFSIIFDNVRCKDRRIKNCWGANGWRWAKILDERERHSHTYAELLQQLKFEVQSVCLNDEVDSIKWSGLRRVLSPSSRLTSFYKIAGYGIVESTVCGRSEPR